MANNLNVSTNPATCNEISAVTNAVDDLSLSGADNVNKKPLFTPIEADDVDNIMVVESLCLSCEGNGETRLFLTNIPHFREVVLSSFSCPHCLYKNTDIMPSQTYQELASTYTLKVHGPEDMNRQVVRQASASFKIVELDFEAPGFTVKGSLTTIEGLFHAAINGLDQNQIIRRVMEPDVAAKIDEIIEKLKEYQTGSVPFTLQLHDPSGNSFIENLHAPAPDPKMTIVHRKRTLEEEEQLGMKSKEEDKQVPEELERRTDYFTEIEAPVDTETEVFDFPSNCWQCQSPVMEHMKMVQIPNFKEVVLMSSVCDYCGSKTTEVKAGGAIEDMGSRITLHMTDASDLSRDVLKSESCQVKIPELDLELRFSSAGKFTSLEGLLQDIKEDLGRVNPFAYGDSAASNKKMKMDKLKSDLDKVIAGELFVTIVFDDPVGNSYIQNTYAPDDDPELKIEKYERTAEQNEEFGIEGMNTENYREEDKDNS